MPRDLLRQMVRASRARLGPSVGACQEKHCRYRFRLPRHSHGGGVRASPPRRANPRGPASGAPSPRRRAVAARARPRRLPARTAAPGRHDSRLTARRLGHVTGKKRDALFLESIKIRGREFAGSGFGQSEAARRHCCRSLPAARVPLLDRTAPFAIIPSIWMVRGWL